MIDTFLSYIVHQKAYSAHTQAAYESDLYAWEAFLKEEFDLGLQEAKQEHLRSWMMNLKRENNFSASSIARKLASLRSFYKYTRLKKGWTSDPTQGVRAPKKEKKLPSVVKEGDIQQLLESDIFPEGWEGKRDRLMLEVFYQTGIRRAELIDLSWKDVRFADKVLRVFGKRSKERVIPLSPLLMDMLEDFRQALLGEFEALPDSLFCSSSGKPLSASVVYKLVNHYLGMTQATKSSPHVLRHSFATHMLNNGADLNAIKELLGHANLAATQVYTHNSIEKVKSVYNQAHPRSHKQS